MFLAVYVDDLVIAAKGTAEIQVIKDQLAKKFDMEDMGQLYHFLGMKVIQNIKSPGGSIWVGQDRYTQDILRKYGMSNCKPASTPMDPGYKPESAKDTDELVNQGLYQSAIGSLLFLGIARRPDISYAVSNTLRIGPIARFRQTGTLPGLRKSLSAQQK